jgi:molybdopterin molybdotransferase
VVKVLYFAQLAETLGLGTENIAQDGSLQVELTGKQGSGILNSMSKANCFIVLTESESNPSSGDQVRVEFFDHYF